MLPEFKDKAKLYIEIGIFLDVIYFGINGLPLILLLVGSILIALAVCIIPRVRVIAVYWVLFWE